MTAAGGYLQTEYSIYLAIQKNGDIDANTHGLFS